MDGGGEPESGLAVLESGGGGTFTRAFLPSAQTCRPGWVEAADLDGDARLDLVTTHFECAWTGPAGDQPEGNLTVLLNPRAGLSSRVVKISLG